MSQLKDSTLVLEPDDSHAHTYKVKVDQPTVRTQNTATNINRILGQNYTLDFEALL